jgi:hypothetical protein
MVILIACIMVLPASSLGGDCSQAESLLDKALNNERKLLELENKFPRCVQINVALYTYYKEKKMWISALGQGEKIEK